MKRIQLWSVALALAALAAGSLAGCTGGNGSGTGGGNSADKRFLKLGTAPVGGAFFVVGDALAQVVNEFKEAGVGKVSATATKGSQQNIRDLDQGKLDFALSNSAITYFAVRGDGGWEKQYDIKAVMTLAPNIAMFLTLENSGIKTIADLKGKRVSIGPAGAGFEYFVEPLLKAHGVSMSDFTPLYATQTDAVDQLGDGSAAAAFLGGAVPTSSIVQACSSQDIHFVPFDPAARTQLIEEYAFFQSATIPIGTYSDLKEEFPALNVGSMHLVTTGNQDEDLVYQFTKTIYENREDVVKKHPAGKAINPKVVVSYTGTEFHPGAIRYYKEIGIWPEDAPKTDEAGQTGTPAGEEKSDGAPAEREGEPAPKTNNANNDENP